MRRSDDLRGYALKRRLNLVPHQYPAPDRMRGVFPPITLGEARRNEQEAAARRAARVGSAPAIVSHRRP